MNNYKQLLFGDETRTPILRGVEKAAKAVISTLGPLGRNVVIHMGPMRPPLITKDGVTVAKAIKAFIDPYEDTGLQMVKEAASKTNDIAGDGTTTSTLLAYELMKEGLNHIKKGSNAIHIRRGMQRAAKIVYEKLEEMAITVDTPEQFKAIATISSQDEEIGALVALVIHEIGKDGAVTVETGQALGIDYKLTEGMQMSSGWASKYFCNVGGKLLADIKNPYILVCDERITDIHKIIHIVEMVAAKGSSLVIIAESVEDTALDTLVANLPQIKIQGQDPTQKMDFPSLAIRAPEIGERRNDVLQDIAIKVGARIASKRVNLPLNSIVLEDLGRADRIIAGATVTTIVNGIGSQEAVDERSSQISDMIEQSQDEGEKDFLRGRLANLTGHIATIMVGASSQVEQQEKQHRVEDAISAVRAAAEEGIVAGGGTALLACEEAVREGIDGTIDEKLGMDIVYKTLSKPLWWIAQNAGHEGDEIIEKVRKHEIGHGFNAETGHYVNMVEHSIIDPKKVARCALENAVSVAGAFLTLEVGIADIPETVKQ